MPGPPTLADLGEDDLLALVFPRLPPAPGALVGPGDDAALLAAPDARVVVTTDLLVEGRDFRREWSSGADVGWKAAAQNLADVAAMGAAPTGLVVGLAAPTSLEVAWVLDLADGLRAACDGTGAGVVGGDLSSASEVVVSVTALGDLGGRRPVLRSGARAGDVVALAGVLGESAAGLALLTAGRVDVAPELVAAHRRPHPPYAAGVTAATAGATAMLDVSDGLLRDADRLARASGVVIDLDGVAIGDAAARLEPAALAAQIPGSGWEWVLRGGEDHGLLATFPGEPPAPFTVVGRCQPALSPPWPAVLLDGHDIGALGGWDHFRAR